jgi:hypothetical protein
MKRTHRIQISEKHGVNPSMDVCFYCNKDNGQIVLPGRMRKGSDSDAEAPRRACWTKVPCDECKGHMELGIILISARKNDPDPQNPYRTGGWCVVTEEAFVRIFQQAAPARRCAFVDDEAWELVGLPRGEEIDNRPKAQA